MIKLQRIKTADVDLYQFMENLLFLQKNTVLWNS